MPEFESLVEPNVEPVFNVKARLVTWAEAERAIDDWFENWWSNLERKLDAYRGWRAWNAKRQAWSVFVAAHAAAHANLYNALFPQNRRRTGNQTIVTGNWNPREIRAGVEVGMFSGKPAWKRPRGRPPLSEYEWLERANARTRARRKRNKTAVVHKDRKPPLTEAPALSHGRPGRGETFGDGSPDIPHGTPRVNTYESADAERLRNGLIETISAHSESLGEDVREAFVALGESLGNLIN